MEASPASDLSREDYQAIRSILLGYRADGVNDPLLPMNVDIDGDGTCDAYALDENDDVVYRSSAPLKDTVYISDGDDIVMQGGEFFNA
jgi:hypothetical protein